MQHPRKRIGTFISLLACTTLCAFAMQPKESPGETMARMMKLGEKFATPNEHHALLASFAGEWMTSTSIMGMDPTSGAASNQMTLGHRFLESTHNGSFMGLDFQGRTTLGYDNYKHKFVATFIDNLGTSMRSAEGTLDRSKSILSLFGTMDEWMTDEHDKPVLYRYILKDENLFILEIHDLAIVPGDTKVIEVIHTRAE